MEKPILNTYHKKFYLLCEECNNMREQNITVTYGMELNSNFYQDFTNYYICPTCGKETLHFDLEYNIARSVRLLRLHKYETKFSCQGHSVENNHSVPYISILIPKKNIELESKIFNSVINIIGWNATIFDRIVGEENCAFVDPNNDLLRLSYNCNILETSEETLKNACNRLFRGLSELFLEKG